MRQVRRVAVVFSAVLLVGIVALVLRTLGALGIFTDVSAITCDAPALIHGMVGPEDMRYDATSNALFISATDRRLWPRHPSPKDGIYVYRPGGDSPPFRLTGTAGNFHPLGISIFRAADGSLTLMAVNPPAQGKPAIDIFSVSDPKTAKIALHEQSAITGDLLISPNSVVAIDKNRFYATNDHTSRTGLGLALETYLTLPRADVVYFDGSQFRVVADGLRFANGIAMSPDGTHVYVAETTGREIRTYKRSAFTGDLSPVSQLPIASGLDNIAVTAKGDLLVAGAPKLFSFLIYRDDPTKPSPSQIFRLAVDTHGIPRAAELIYSGTDIGAASVGLPVRDRLMIGSVLDPKILSCTLPR